MIISLDQGIEEIHHFFENMQLGIMLGSRPYELKIESLNLKQVEVKISPENHSYKIENWIALNQDNFQAFTNLTSLAEQLTFLEKTLTGNLLSFAKGIGWLVTEPIVVKVTKFDAPRLISLKGRKILSFNVSFNSNVLLPNHIGLGKSSSQGFGLLKSTPVKQLYKHH